jgi:hypothetical protein
MTGAITDRRKAVVARRRGKTSPQKISKGGLRMAKGGTMHWRARTRQAATAIMGTAAALGVVATALAGPPFRTDDPVPVDYQHWEIYAFAQGTQASGSKDGVSPGIEVNYGILPNTMVHLILPAASYASADGQTSWGYGDTELGVKYRFLDGGPNGSGVIVGTFPLVVFPTGNEHIGLGSGHTQAFLPIWLQKNFGSWTTYGGGGYWINPGSGNKDYWFVGWLLQRQVTDHLALGGEVFYQTADAVDSVDSTGFNLGGIYDFSEHQHLLFSAGTGIQNANQTNRFSYYLGYQLTF